MPRRKFKSFLIKTAGSSALSAASLFNAGRSRVVLLKIKNVGIDISLGALFFVESAVERATVYEFLPGIALRTCSAEDLIVFKSFAARLQDWADIENILSVQKNLDWNYIFEQLGPLVELKEEPEILSKLRKLKTEIFR